MTAARTTAKTAAEIRRLAPGDPALPGLLALTVAAFADLPASPAQKLTLDRLEAKLAEGPGFVAEAAGAPVGGLFARPSRDVPGACYVGTLAVAPGFRGQGLAGCLMACAEARARRDGQPALTLDTYAGAAHLIGLFGAMGFVANARLGDVVTMVRLLDPPLLRLAPGAAATTDAADLLADLLPGGVVRDAGEGERWAIGTPPLAAVLLVARADALGLCNLACARPYRGLGLVRRLVALAEDRARAAGLPALDLHWPGEPAIPLALGFHPAAQDRPSGGDRPAGVTFRKPVDADAGEGRGDPDP